MDKECLITLEPSGRRGKVAPRTTVLEAIGQLGGEIRSDCGGAGICGKCLVVADNQEGLSKPTKTEDTLLMASAPDSSYRAACQTEIIADATIRLVDTSADNGQSLGKCRIRSQYHVDTMIQRIVLGKGDAQDGHCTTGGSAADNLRSALGRIAALEIGALRQLSRITGDNQPLTVVLHEERGITAVLAGDRCTSLGLAVDVGTTTIAAYLLDLANGNLLASAAGANPQRCYGEDVISRIAAAEKTDTLARLSAKVRESINMLLSECLGKRGAAASDIDEVVIVGNTTMQTLLVGMSPASLGVSPYLPVIRDALNLRAENLGLDLNPGTNIYVFPVISGFLGGDALAAALGYDGFSREKTSLIIDLGTNGELILCKAEHILATSCATGPALEGANISCGMRATTGAISQVDIDPMTMQPKCTVIGGEDGARPLGICGSGLIDAMAAMYRAGVLTQSGRLNEDAAGVICDRSGLGLSYLLVSAEQSGTGKAIVISQQDVRAFQLAKAALAVGIEVLMEQMGVRHVDRTVLTGAFGVHFNWKNAAAVGMIPRKAAQGEVVCAENLAGVGAVMALLDKKKRIYAEKLARTIQFVELAMVPDFNERFVTGTAFPPPREMVAVQR